MRKWIRAAAVKSGLLDFVRETTLDELCVGSVSGSGEAVTARSAMQVSAVYACVGILSESLAQLPVKVLRRTSDGGSTEDRGALWRLLNRPNDWQTSFEFREMAMQHLCLHGNFFAWKVRDNSGQIKELLPLPPGAVSVDQDEHWGVVYRVNFKDIAVTTSARDVMHLRYRTLDGVRGISPIGYSRETIGLALATMKHGNNVFKNGAAPGGVLEHPGKMSKDAQDRLRESWLATHGGANSGGLAILEEGMKYAPVSMSNEDAQYIQTRQFTVEEIARIYRVPLHEIQSTQKTTSWGSGIEAMNIGFVTRTIMPWVKRWEEGIARDLIAPEDADSLYVKFNLGGFLRGDMTSRFNTYRIAIEDGIMSPNEVRELEDLNPREGGDVYLTPMNLRENGDAAQDEPAAPEDAPGSDGDPDDEGVTANE